ncbi:sensor histidine kinase [Cognatilysobacter terrigena]|uniref:sensor histidine kinase n=1 Tax=Cognatilysobacter terrigena TaxID=2488749 RepID=UPI00105DCECB|nr:ATP-binding protein [Lysobacter terrigena]
MPTDRMDPTASASTAWLSACAAPTALIDADGRVLAANAAFTRRLHVGEGARLADVDPALGDRATLDSQGPSDVAGHPTGHLHIGTLDATHRVAQWIDTPPDHHAEQRQLQMFADTVAHDLRAPLRSIESFAKLLEDRASEKLDASERMHLSRIRAAATRMSGLLVALGELSRAASAPMQPGEVDISILCEWALAELHDLDHGRDVIVHVDPGLRAVGDERLLRQLLKSLLENAWKFTRNVDQPRIDVHGERVGRRLKLVIRDTGAGFDMQYAHKLFQPFQRLHGLDQGAGHGLGLAIAQRIAQRHGGHITAESTEGQGSTFTVDLPAVDD